MRRAVLAGLGVLLLLVAAAGVAYPLWWQHRQSTVGRREVLSLARVDASGCSVSTAPGPGILRIPSLSVVAPVVQGVSDATLAVSVGHFPTSPWPGERGISVLEAHDVGYFASNSSLAAGDLVTYETGCRVDTYRVVRQDVLHPGQVIREIRKNNKEETMFRRK
jgi:sortase A